MKRDPPGSTGARRWFVVRAALLAVSPACGDAGGAPPPSPVMPQEPDAGQQPPPPSGPKEAPARTGDGVPPDGVPTMAAAPALPAHCASPEIHRINRPASMEDPTLGRFAYRFRYKPPGVPGAPVLVVLPGGPGRTSTGSPPAFMPPGWGYLLTDPRGTGCNALDEVPYGPLANRFFLTREIAADVVGALDALPVQSYVLFGTGHGSVVGQTLASRLEERRLAARAVVLEGVFGRAFRPDEFVAAGYVDQWDRWNPVLPDDVRRELASSPTPYGLDPPHWSRALLELLSESPLATVQLLVTLSSRSGSDDARRAAVIDSIRRHGEEEALSPGERELRRQIVCREIAETPPGNGLDLMFMSGVLVRNSADEGTLCRDLRLTTPFDAAATAYAAPVYYFVGEDDPAAPPWQGAYAFDQHQGRATRVLVRGGAHRALTGDLAPCAPAVIASIGAGGVDLIQALAACPATVQVDAK